MRSDIQALIGPPKHGPGRPPKPDPEKRPRGGQLKDHRQRKVLADAKLTELKIAKFQGETVSAADVAREWESIMLDVRNRLLAVPGRCAAEGVPREHVDIVDKQIRAALQALSGAESAAPASPEAGNAALAVPGAKATASKRARGRQK